MSMSPIRTVPDFEDEQWYNEQIERELERITVDEEADQPEQDVDAHDEPPTNNDNFNEESLPETMEEYLRQMQEQSELFERELSECDDLLNHQAKHQGSTTLVLIEEDELLRQAATEQGLDPEDYKTQILAQLEEEGDELELYEAEADVLHCDDDTTDTSVLLTEVRLDSSKGHNSTGDNHTGNNLASDLQQLETKKKQADEFVHGNGVIVLADPSSQLKEFLRDQWLYMEEKQKRQAELLKQNIEVTRCQESEREKQIEEVRREKQKAIEMEEVKLAEELQVKQEKLEDEIAEMNRKVETELQQYEQSIQALEERTRVEQEEEQQQRREALQRWEERRTTAASTIQSTYRGHRVRKVHGHVLKKKKAERMKTKEEERIKEMEITIQERKNQKELKKQEEAKMQQEEAELKRIEERKSREEAERKRIEEEKRKREEEERRKREEEEERTRQDKVRRKKEEEDRIREEMKRKEEERKRQEEERLRKELEERKRKEEDRIRREEEEKKQEERQQQEEERLRKELEERKRKDFEERVRKEEEKRKQQEEERLRKELEESKMKEEEKQMKEVKERRQADANQLNRENGDSANVKMVENNEHMEAKMNGLMGSLPEHVENRRLQWMKDCLPWSKVSNEPWKTKLTPTKKPPKRPSSAKKLCPLAEEVILSAAKTSSLRQVTTVQLSDLPGCNLSSLGQCWGLKHLVMTNCGLIAVDGLGQCKDLQYLDVQHNQIQYVDVKELNKLQYVNLSSNNLTMIHGFEGCANVRWMDLSNNKITKIGSLFGLRRLHTLRLSHNQLISAKGLVDSPTIQTLDLSHNHLQSVDDIDKLCLLQHLLLTGNTLLQVPCLWNHVLLQELLLDDNSITSLDSFAECWLPCLRSLNMAQNSLSDLGEMKFCLSLKDLDISNNQILDGEELVQSLTSCRYLDSLSVEGNPATEDTTFRDTASSSLAHLKLLDGQSVAKPGDGAQPIKARCSYEVMCLTQAHQVKDTWLRFQQELLSLSSSKAINHGDICELYFLFCDKTFQLAIEHRYAHEYGDVTVNLPSAPKTPKLSNRPNMGRNKNILKETAYMSPKEKFDQILTGNSVMTGVTADTVRRELQEADSDKAAAKIQAVWRGYITRRNNTHVYRTATYVKEWTYTDEAAVTIQALWRGYNLRRKLLLALDYARMGDEEDDEDYLEVDLDDFNFNETDLDMDWKPPPTPLIPTSHPVVPVLGKPPSGKLAHACSEGTDMTLPYPPSFPRQAWRNLTSPLSNRSSPQGRPHRPPSSIMTGSDTHRTGLSRKEEQLSEEWGFKDTRTAELMMQRAKKMKYNADKKKKLSKLDPKQKLALFKKLQESTKILKPIQGPMRKALPRKEYFQARAQEVQDKERNKRTEIVTKASRTFEWLHTQVGDLPVTDSCINQNLNRIANSESESCLPRLDEEITAGGRVQLVGSPVAMDLESVGTNEDSIRPRRYSMDERLTPNVNQVPLQLPPIKTNSAPSDRVQERISWRNPKKETNIGWGGGRKRAVHK